MDSSNLPCSFSGPGAMTLSARTAILALVFAAAAACQPIQYWVSLDSSPAGTLPTVTQDFQASSPTATVFRVDVHGFWQRNVVIGPQAFQEISVPGMGAINDPGKPEVPALPLLVGIPTDASGVTVGGVQVLATRTFTNVRVHPAQLHEEDSPQPEPPQPFQFSASAYASTSLQPPVLARMGASPAVWKGLRVQQAYVQPFQVVAATDTLIVRRSLRVTFAHAGTIRPAITVTKRFARVLDHAIANFDVLSGLGSILTNNVDYDAFYLVLTDAQFLEEIEPLADQKRELGYRVTIRTTAEIGGSTETRLRAAVADWYADIQADIGSLWSFPDCYVLLVGDVNYVGICLDPEYGLASDYTLGSIDGDIYAEAGVGRLSVDSETDCANQVAKILEYQEAPGASLHYDNVLLAASTDDSGDERFRGSCEEIAGASGYGYPLDFTKRYGDWSSGTVAATVDDVDDGQGIVVYEGHGNWWQWAGWDYADDALDTTDVGGLANGHAMPVVLALCCQNSNTDTYSDCIGEEWMELYPGGSVAHYGATRNSWICHYTLFGPAFFTVVHDYGIPTLSEALILSQFIAYARNSAANDEHSRKTIWQFQLLGDPAMKIWQETPEDTTLYFDHVAGPPEAIAGFVRDAAGQPLSGAIVGLTKPGDFQVTGYTGPDGAFHIPLPAHGAGTMTIRLAADVGPARGVRATLSLPACLPACPAAPVLTLTQPGGPGSPVLVGNLGLVAGREYYNIFSVEPGPAGPGSGPYLGLAASDPGMLVAQFLTPSGTLPFHFTAPGATLSAGAFGLPPLTLEAVCFDFTGAVLGPVSPVANLVVH